MHFKIALLALICFAAVQARPSHLGHSDYQLYGVPDESHYGKLSYPKFELLELGSETKGEVPPKTVKVINTISVKVPQPFPVKVPVKIPFPIHVPKPYPVVETKFIKVPEQVPVHVEKQVQVHVEVPKPYPVPADEFQAPHPHAQASHDFGTSGTSSFGDHASFSQNQGHQIGNTYGVPGHEAGTPISSKDYYNLNNESGGYGGQSFEGHGEEQSNQWQPLGESRIGEEQKEYEVSDQEEESGGEEQEQH